MPLQVTALLLAILLAATHWVTSFTPIDPPATPLTLVSAAAPEPSAALLADAPQPALATLTPDQVASDLALLERTLTTLHPGYERYTPRSTLDAALADLASDLSSGASIEQFYLEISRFLAMIRCDHTKAEYPASIADFRAQQPTHMPFTVIVRQGRVFIAAATPSSGLSRADEILEIDNQPIAAILGQIRALVPIDGYTDHARDDEIEATSEYMGSALEQFLPLILGWSDSRDLLIRRGQSFLRLAVRCISWDDHQALSPQSLPRNFSDAVRVDFPAPNTALLWVGTFVNYRTPVDPDSVFAPIFADLATRGIQHLIVDLRQNGGGSDDAQIALARRLLRVPVTPAPALVRATSVPQDLRPHLNTWDTSVFDPPPAMFEPEGDFYRRRSSTTPIPPADDAFAGQVTLLTSRGNASGVTILLSSLQDQPHITTVGEPTGGSATGPTAGVLVFLKLPASGITVRVPLIRSRVNNPRAIQGLGITPDLLVEPTADDILAGRDPILNAALRRTPLP